MQQLSGKGNVQYLAPGLPASQGLSISDGTGKLVPLGDSLAMLDDGSSYVMASNAFAQARQWQLSHCAIRVVMADGGMSVISQVAKQVQLVLHCGTPTQRGVTTVRCLHLQGASRLWCSAGYAIPRAAAARSGLQAAGGPL
jgi:hypothetical protein